MIHSGKKWIFLLLVTISWSFFYAFYHTKKLFSANKIDLNKTETVPAYRKEQSGNRTCYFYDDGTNNLQEFDELEPTMGTDIFFHDASCPKNITDINLSPKQACSIESALLAYPKSYVFLLIASPINVSTPYTQNVSVKKLREYSNFYIKHINFTRYLPNTPFQKFVKSIQPGPQASDVLSFASLYKFGGSYLDTDVIVLKPMTNISNFAGVESGSIGSGIFNLGTDTTGREIANDCAKELLSKSSIQDYNWTQLITRVLQKRCNVTKIADINEKTCKGFNVYPESSLTPISSKSIFDNGKWEEIQKLTNKSYTIRIKDNTLNGPKQKNVPYLKLAEKYCPKIFTTGELGPK